MSGSSLGKTWPGRAIIPRPAAGGTQLGHPLGCLGGLAEIFNGDPPHVAKGAFCQAWSVGEVIRAWNLLTAGSGSPAAGAPV